MAEKLVAMTEQFPIRINSRDTKRYTSQSQVSTAQDLKQTLVLLRRSEQSTISETSMKGIKGLKQT